MGTREEAHVGGKPASPARAALAILLVIGSAVLSGCAGPQTRDEQRFELMLDDYLAGKPYAPWKVGSLQELRRAYDRLVEEKRIGVFADLLQSGDFKHKQVAIIALASIGTPAAIDPLVKTLDTSRDPEVLGQIAMVSRPLAEKSPELRRALTGLYGNKTRVHPIPDVMFRLVELVYTAPPPTVEELARRALGER